MGTERATSKWVYPARLPSCIFSEWGFFPHGVISYSCNKSMNTKNLTRETNHLDLLYLIADPLCSQRTHNSRTHVATATASRGMAEELAA